MAVFDPTEERLCVRVVYDGAASAGKTTNLRQLASLFAAQRTTEVISPAELEGRTLFFDWMQIAAGAICGFPLLCQVVSVPGQAAFAARRQSLLESADVVVFVCDSSAPAPAAEALSHLALLADTSCPLVVQANKQDQLDAVDGKTLLAMIRAPEGRLSNMHIVEAIATDGIGVVDTFVSAVRAAARAVQARLDANDLYLQVRPAENDRALLHRLAGVEIDREGAAELLLEEATHLFATYSLSAIAMPAAGAAAPPAIVIDDATLHHEPSATPDEEIKEERNAPLPTGHVPTGFVWPAHTGRAMLHALGHELPEHVPVVSGAARFLARDHGRVLTTSISQRFTDLEQARQALVRAARERTQLQSLLVSDTVLVVQPEQASSSTSWLWMVIPQTSSITDWLMSSDLRARLEVLAAAIVDAVEIALRHALDFTPSLSAFGVQGGIIRYVGPLSTTAASIENPLASAARLLLGVLSEAEAASSAIRRDLDAGSELSLAMSRRLETRLRSADRERLGRALAEIARANSRPMQLAHTMLQRALSSASSEAAA